MDSENNRQVKNMFHLFTQDIPRESDRKVNFSQESKDC